MTESGHTLDYDGKKEDLKDIQSFADLDFHDQLLNNLAENGQKEPSPLQMDILKLLDKKISIAGNVPINSGGEHAVLAYTIAACLKAKEEGTFKNNRFCPFAVFVVASEYMLAKYCGIAKALSKDLDIIVVKGNNEDFLNDRKCEDVFEKCDIAILTADSFHKFCYDDLVDTKDMKIFGVQNLDWFKDIPRMDRYKHLFKDDDFPRAGERTMIFFDDHYIAVADEVWTNDAKAFIFFGEGEKRVVKEVEEQKSSAFSKPGFRSNGFRPQFVRNPDAEAALKALEAEEERIELERAARGDPKHIFEVVPKDQRTAAVIERLQKLFEECGNENMKFPRTIIYVENAAEANALFGAITRNLKRLSSEVLECVKLTKNVRSTLENFHDYGRPRILIIYRKGVDIVFKKIDHYFFMNCAKSYELFTQMCFKDPDIGKPLTFTSFCTHQDVKKLEIIKKSLEKYNLPVDDLDAMIKDLTPLYRYDSEDDDDDFF